MSPLLSTVRERLDRSCSLYRDLIETLEESRLGETLPNLRSNTIGLQLWCVVGARESYTKAIRENEWAGFSCSLLTATEKGEVAAALERSGDALSAVLRASDSFSEAQCRLIVDLLEHEAAHQGQLIRYLYGLRLAIPESWKSRFALAD